MKLLLNQTWVHLPDAQQSQSADTGLWWRTGRRLLHGAKQGECAASAQKTQTPRWLLGKGF